MEKTGLAILLLLAQWTLSTGVTRKYHYVQLLKTWSEAQSYCRENFADLATIETPEDWAVVSKMMETADRVVWVGLYDDINGWRWSVDNTHLYGDGSTELGEWFSFKNRRTQYCVVMIAGTLYDFSCNRLQKSVCYDESTNNYIAVTVPMTWSSAQSYCREKYTDLTSMRTKHEKEAIMSVIDETAWWVGLSRDHWAWSDRSSSKFRKWRRNEPNARGRELCVSTLTGGFADLSCAIKYAFICSVPIMGVLKVELKVKGPVDPNDSPVQEAVLKHMEKHMRDHGIHQKFRLKWRKQPNGKIFKKRKAEP